MNEKVSKPTLKLFYLGDIVYFKSGSILGAIHEVGTFVRSDWGKVGCALARGESVTIRPANEKELKWVEQKLKSLGK